MKIYLKGLNSCQMRNQKLAHYAGYLIGNGHCIVPDPAESDAILLWTCAFREDVLDNSLQELKRYRDENDAEVFAVGCLPDIAPDILDGRGITVVPWKQEKGLLEERFGACGVEFDAACPILVEDAKCEDAVIYRLEHPEADATFHDQFVKVLVSEGCPFKCTYCTERLAFPPFRSFPASQLVDSVAALVATTGHTRLILISDCLGEYGKDIGTTLPELMRAIRARDERITFALNNLHPKNFLEYMEEMNAFIRTGWIEHLNLPVQSGSDRVLKQMQRQYTRSQLLQLFGRLRELSFTRFDTHVIVGFPGETDEDFEQTLSLILEIRPQYVLLSKFLETPRAPAALLADKIPEAVVWQRVEKASHRFLMAGIICNWEGSDLGEERLRRLNQTHHQSQLIRV